MEFVDLSTYRVHGLKHVLCCDAAAMLESMGLNDGQFLIRQHQDPGVYALAVTYKGKPTHHKVSKVDGVFAINNKKYGQFATLDELVGGLSAASPPQGWPVRLIVEAAPPAASTPHRAHAAPAAARVQSPPAQSSTSWLHGEISREEASGTLVEDAAIASRPPP